jgi:hypothetical protein
MPAVGFALKFFALLLSVAAPHLSQNLAPVI